METLREFVKSFIYFEDPEGESLLPTHRIQAATHQPHPTLPLILTHQLYLDVRRKNDIQDNYLDFIQKTYYEHFKDSIVKSWICTKSSFYFFIGAFFPNLFPHYAPDLIVKLSDIILDEYSKSFETRAAACS